MSIIRSMTAEDAAKVASLEAEIFRSRGVRMLFGFALSARHDLSGGRGIGCHTGVHRNVSCGR